MLIDVSSGLVQMWSDGASNIQKTTRHTLALLIVWLGEMCCYGISLCSLPRSDVCTSSAADRGGGATGAVCPRPPVWRRPQTVLNSFNGSLFSSQSSFFKRSVSLYCWFHVSLLTLLTQTSKMHTLSYVTTAQMLTIKGPVRRTFWSETTKRRRQLAGMYCMHARKGASEAPQNTLQSM